MSTYELNPGHVPRRPVPKPPFTEGLGQLRNAIEEARQANAAGQRSTAARGDGGVPRARRRNQGVDPTARQNGLSWRAVPRAATNGRSTGVTAPGARTGPATGRPIPRPSASADDRADPDDREPPEVAPAEPRGASDDAADQPAGPASGDTGGASAEVRALVERAQAGDNQAFGLLYDRYVDTVFRFTYFRVGNRQLAEDLTSETFVRALRRITSFTWQGRDPGAWLVTIARNLVADHFKSGRYRLEVTAGDVLDPDRVDRAPEASPERVVVDRVTNLALLKAVKQLNREQQECIVLRFLQGFSVSETAQAMGKNEGAIKALQYRALRTLQRLLPPGFAS